MKTTVKRFILDNMTGINYEKLIDMLIVESVGIYDLEMADKIEEYLNNQGRTGTEKKASEKRHEIEKRFNYFGDTDLSDEEELPIDTSPVTNHSEDSKGDGGDDDFDIELAIDIEAHEVDVSNYQEFVAQMKGKVDFKLAKFIFDIMHHESEKKMENNIDQFLNEKSHVKIENNNEYNGGYCVYFLLDNRTRYISTEAHSAYLNRTDVNIPVISPGFVEYDILQEDLSMYENTYILAPYTSYLNEEITVPDVSEEVIYDLLEMFIHILTFQGFTEEEQLEEINYNNEHYDKQFI